MKSKKHNYLNTALTLALTGTVGLTYSTAVQAGLVTEDYDFNLYGDFAEGKGIFSPGSTDIKVYDKDGKLKGTIAKALDVAPVMDGLFGVFVGEQYIATANHVTSTQNATFGVKRELIYNDGTLFEGSVLSKPFTGPAHSNEFNLLIRGSNNWKPLFEKYLGVQYKQVNEVQVRNTNNYGGIDFKIVRYSKLITDAAPVNLPESYDDIKNGQYVARVGAGTARQGFHGQYPKSFEYGTPIGGINTLTHVSRPGYTDRDIDAANGNKTVFKGGYFGTHFKEYGPGILESGTLPGDSGSPLFWYNENKKQWEFLGSVNGGNFDGGNENELKLSFGKQSYWYGSGPWVEARMAYYKAPETKLEDGQSVVVHGQNPYTGDGYLHIVDSGVSDFTDTNFKEDVKKVKDAIDLDMHHQKWVLQADIDFRLETIYNKSQGLPPPVKNWTDHDPDTRVPTADEFYNTDYQVTTQGVKKQLYKGYAFGADYSGYVNETTKKEKNAALIHNPRSLTFTGAGNGKKHNIYFSDDFEHTNGKINLGAGSITIQNGDFTLVESTKPEAAITSFVHAGYDIKNGASLTISYKGEAGDAIHKIGAGTLRITGNGDQLSPLNVGDGLVVLDRTNGTATPHLKLASGRATVQLNQDGQLNMNFESKANNAAVGFGQNGGILDFNGHDKNTTWIDIYHMDSGAILANSKKDEASRVTFTFAPNGKRTFLGGFYGNFNINYSTTDITDDTNKSWLLKGNSEISGNFDVAANSHITVGDVATERGWGQHYADRYDYSSFISNGTTLGDNAILTVGRNGLFASHITLGTGATLDVHNRGDYTDASQPYGIENQAQREKTVLAGSVNLGTGKHSQVNLEATKGTFIDVHSSFGGDGTITTLGAGTISFGGDNSQFKGTVKVCDVVGTSADSTCSQTLSFSSQAAADVKLPALDTTFDLTEGQKTSIKDLLGDTTPRFESLENEPMPADVAAQLNEANSAATADATSSANTAPTTGVNTTAASSNTDSAATGSKPTITDKELEEAKKFEEEHKQAVAEAQQNAKQPEANPFATYVPVPNADSQVINFFGKNALFTSASTFDTSNARVILRTAFTDANEGDVVRWDMKNVSGDAFLVKDDKSTLQLRNYTLGGTIFVNDGKLVTDKVHGHVVVGKGATFLADARTGGKASIDGRVVNSGVIYLTAKNDQLPEVFASDVTTTQPIKDITTPSTTPTLKLTLEPQGDTSPAQGASASAPVLASNGLELAALRPEHQDLINLASSSFGPVFATYEADPNVSPLGLEILEQTQRKNSTLEVGGDYIGQDGTIFYDLNDSYYNLKVKGKVEGTTTLIVNDIKAATAQANESFKLIETEGGFTKDAIKLQSTTVSGGIIDYVFDMAGDSLVLSSVVNTDKVDVVPETPPAPPAPEPAPVEPPKEETTQPPAPQPDPQPTPPQPDTTDPQPGTDSGNGNNGGDTGTNPPTTDTTPSTPEPAPQPVPTPKPDESTNSGTNGNDGNGNQAGNGTTDGNQNGSGVVDPDQGKDEPDSAPVQPEPNQPAPPSADDTTDTQPPTAQPDAQPSTPTEEQPEQPTTPETQPQPPKVEIATPAGPRYINSSVGTLLANRRFISNMNVTPASLAFRPGFYLDVDRDSEALEFTGARYTSSYAGKRTLVGNNFTLRPDLQVGLFANLGTATSTINNQLNSATGKVQAYGLGGTIGTRLGSAIELSGAAQYLYAQTSVSGTHNQQETLHGGFAALQAAVAAPRIGDATNFIQVKPYALLQAEFTPTSHFVSRIGEDLGTVTADRYTQAVGVQATVNLDKFAVEVDAYKNLGTRATEFNSFYTPDNISAKNNNYRVKTTASYQVAPAVRVKAYFNAQGTQRTSGVGLDIKW